MPEVKGQILVIDDEPQTAQLLRQWFGGRPFEILEAANAEEGLRAAAERSPDLILLDLKMPGVDGFSAARRLKQNPATSSIPASLLTACRDTEAKVKAFAAGADDYVTKPFDFAEIDARIHSWLRKRVFLTSLESRVRDLTATNEQLEQLLVNLVRNAVDAALETKGQVELSWSVIGDRLHVVVADEGPGLPVDTGNLFVPFYTTKPGGSGIGLALCRQIAEGHGGTLILENAPGGKGARARLTIPLDLTPAEPTTSLALPPDFSG